MESVLEKYRDHPEFQRYFQVWRQNEASIVFVPLANILRADGCLPEAREICERGLKHNPESVSGRLLLASIYWDLGQKKEADRLAREILVKMPTHPEAHKYLLGRPTVSFAPLMRTLTMAEILAKQEAFDDACAIVEELLQADPENEGLKKRLAEWRRQGASA